MENTTEKKLPAGTTQEQWDRYYKEKESFEIRMRAKEPKKESFGFAKMWPDAESERAYDKAYSEWHMAYFCDAPNEPGYYRANND